MIERTFLNIPEGERSNADQQSFLVGLGWSKGTTWEGLLRSKRVLLISEAGAGKTYECRKQAQLSISGDDNLPTSVGHGWAKGPRNAPKVFNTAQFWDGRAKDLKEQAKSPVQAAVEMNSTPELVVKTLTGERPKIELPILPIRTDKTPKPKLWPTCHLLFLMKWTAAEVLSCMMFSGLVPRRFFSLAFDGNDRRHPPQLPGPVVTTGRNEGF